MFFRFVARLSRLIPWTNWKSASAQLLAPLLTFYLLKMPNDWSVPAVVVGYEFLCNGAYLCNSSFKLVLALPYISWFTLTSTVTSTYSVCPVCSYSCQVRALRLESYRPPKKKRALSLDSVLPNDAPPNAAAVANSENSNSTSNSTSNGNSDNSNNTNNNNNSSSNDNTSSRRRGKSQERADRLSDDAGSAGAVVATREGSRRSGDGNTNQNGGNSGGGNSGENTHATNTARGSRESRESLELPCGPFDEVADPRGPAWVTAWDREGVKALDAAFAKADLENDK